ncbi:hypothetical protein FOXYSP1_16948 [Fusarium oxysporum f. sp. phaseoli]
MANSSPISSKCAQLTAIERLGWDFYSFFRVEYPEKNKTQIGRVRKSYGRREYVCLHCSTRWSIGYTSNAITHAQNRHRQLIQASETSQNSQQSMQPSIHSYIAFQPSDSALRNVFNAQRYIEAIVGLLTRRRVPFSSVTWDEMKSLALACNPAIEDCLITGRDQAMKIINANYGLYASQLRDLIQAVCAQWVDYNYTLRKVVLGLPECPFSHSGEAQAALIVEVLRNFDILRVGYHTGDNATSNNTCLEALSEKLKAELQEALTAALNATISDESVDMVDRFAATLAETISQQEEPVLQGKWPKSTAKASQKTGIDEVYTGWQGIPALQKLHNLAVWLRSSSLHSDSWRDAVGLSLGIDNATRWSSWYKVIDNAIRKKVQINQFLFEHDRELEDTVLSGSDWDLLAKTHAFLEPFASATLYAEGKCSSVSQSLFLMDALLFHYESAKVQHSQPGSMDTRMLHAIEMGWFVLDKYYTMTEDVPVYAAALLLDPSKRLAYIQQNWPRDWHEAAIAGARDIWMTEYQGLAISKEPERRPAPLPSKKDAISTDSDNLDSFINALPLEIDCTPLEWWSRLEQRAQYPRLSRMAIDILSIPSESAEPERAFSGARRTASWDRLRITCKNLEKVECIGNWLREGLIVPSGEGGLGLVYKQAF